MDVQINLNLQMNTDLVVLLFSVIGYCKLSLRIHFKLVQKIYIYKKCRNMKEVRYSVLSEKLCGFFTADPSSLLAAC